MKIFKNILLAVLVIILIVLLAMFSNNDDKKVCVEKRIFVDKYHNKLFDNNKYNVIKECK